MKKKKLFIGLAVIASALSLASCVKTNDPSNSTSIPNVESSTVQGNPSESGNANPSSSQSNVIPSTSSEGGNVDPTPSQSSKQTSVDYENGDEVSVGFGEGLTSWSVLEAEAGTKESSGKTVFAKEVTMNDITFPSNSKNRVDNGATYSVQQTEITIVMKSAGTIHVEGKWGSTSAGGYVYLKNSTGTEVYKSSQYSANTGENIADISFTKDVPAGTYKLSADKSINLSKLYYSRTIEVVTVTYVTEHGTKPESLKLEKNDKLQSLPEMYEEGYVFEGWYNDDTKYDINTAIISDLTLTAKWKVYDANDYAIVKFNMGVSNQEVNDMTIEKNHSIENMPTVNDVNGYRFDGWYTDETFASPFNSGSAITSNITLYAKFVRQYNVTFKYEDETVISAVKVDSGDTIATVPSAKTIYGKTFDGWYNGTTKFDVTSTISADVVLVAKYETVTTTSTISVMSSAAYNEGLYAEFMPFESASSYNAYVKSVSSEYTKLDTQLIRTYRTQEGNNTYLRVDAVGLKAGTYTLKIVPVISGTEADAAKVELANLTVTAHDRSGFGFVNGTSSGAYNDDGTLKSGARVFYVTNSNKDTVETTAIESKATITVNGVQNILAKMKSQKGISDPVCIRFIGNILDPANMPKGDLYVDGVKDLTIEGIGTDATMNGFGIVIKGSSNVEIRNLGFMNCDSSEGDDCGLQQDNDHVWVHNCDFFYGHAGSDGDQAKGDGALDTKKSKYVTHSYNHFWDNGKCNLQGMTSETETNYITYHHNWYDHSDSRHPRVRTCTVHVYNNYFDGNAKYGIGSALGASIFAENNYFRSTSNTIPFMTGKMAHDIKDEGGNVLSGEAGGLIKAYGNVLDGNAFRFTPYSAANAQNYDAYVVSSRDEKVPSSVYTPSGKAYNNFDTDSSIMYQYTVQTAEEAKNSVIQNAGRVQGGDFKWTFNNAVDDADYNVNKELKAALTAYTGYFVSAQGIDASGSVTPTPSTDKTPDQVMALIAALPEASAVAESDRTNINAAKAAYDALSVEDKAIVTNYSKLEACIAALPTSGGSEAPAGTQVLTFPANNTFFTVSGNTSTSKGTVTYKGTEYKTCLKMESSTKVSFTTSSQMTITLVFASSETSKKVIIDGKEYTTDSNAAVTVTLAAGSHQITKKDSINLFYLSLE